MIRFSFVPVVYIFRTAAALFVGKKTQQLSKPASSLAVPPMTTSDADGKKEQEEKISALSSCYLVRLGCWASCLSCLLLLLSPPRPNSLNSKGQSKAKGFWVRGEVGMDGPKLEDKLLSLQPISATSLAPCHLTSLGMRVTLSRERQHAMESLPWQKYEVDCPSPRSSTAQQPFLAVGFGAWPHRGPLLSSHNCLLWRKSIKSLWGTSSITQLLFH